MVYEIKMPTWNICEMTGYTPKTTFWDDFSIADRFGVSAVQDTYNRAFNEWKDDHIYLTELVLVLNWKLWYHYENGDEELSRLYNDLWGKTDEYAIEHLNGEALRYFYDTVD